MILEFKSVTGTNGTFSLQDVSFALPAGYIMGLAGKNGAGKSTLMDYILNRQQKYTGEILLNGVNIRENHWKMLEKIGFISDENRFMMEKTAEQNAQVLGAAYENWDMVLFREKMREMGLSTKKAVERFSRGEYFKFQTAFAMAHRPCLYLIDEATAGMDPVFRIDYFKILQKLIANEGASILMTSHIQDEIARKMDYVGIMENGRLIEFGEALDVM